MTIYASGLGRPHGIEVAPDGALWVADAYQGLTRVTEVKAERQITQLHQTDQNTGPDADHRTHKGLNNAIEISHRPTRKRENIFGRFKSHRQAQRFLSALDRINLILRPRRYHLNATSYRHARSDAFSLWAVYTAEMVA